MSLSTSKQQSLQALTPKSTNYNGIDLVKFLCAIMVFIIHVRPFPEQLSSFTDNFNFYLQHCLCSIAVPFFFICSGFFLFKKMSLSDINIDIVRNYCFKILRLLGIWSVLSFIGETEHLWYLGATVIATILLCFCFYSHIKISYIGVIAVLLYVIGLLGDSYYGLIAPLKNISIFHYILRGYETFFETTRNGVFMGFIFVLMGAWFAHHNIKLAPWASLVGFIVSMLCLFIEALWLRRHDFQIEYNMYIFLLPAVYFLFAFASNVQLKDHPIYKHLRKLSMMIYFSHLVLNEFAWMTVSILNKILPVQVIRYQFIVSLTFTLTFTIFIEWLSNKKKFNWINLLFS